jgi:hypothetical protein
VRRIFAGRLVIGTAIAVVAMAALFALLRVTG